MAATTVKRIKRVQMVERPIPSFHHLHPATHPQFFGNSRAVLMAKQELKKQLQKNGWRQIRFDYKSNGILVVYGQRLKELAELENAKAGLYDLYLMPPKIS